MVTAVSRPPVPEAFFTASEVAGLLDRRDWAIIVNEARARSTLIDRTGPSPFMTWYCGPGEGPEA